MAVFLLIHIPVHRPHFSGEGISEEMETFFPFFLIVSNLLLKESRAAGLGFCKGGDKL